MDLQNVMSDEEKKKLFEAIGYDGEDTSAGNYPKEVEILTILSFFHWKFSRFFSVYRFRFERSIAIARH